MRSSERLKVSEDSVQKCVQDLHERVKSTHTRHMEEVHQEAT